MVGSGGFRTAVAPTRIDILIRNHGQNLSGIEKFRNPSPRASTRIDPVETANQQTLTADKRTCNPSILRPHSIHAANSARAWKNASNIGPSPPPSARCSRAKKSCWSPAGSVPETPVSPPSPPAPPATHLPSNRTAKATPPPANPSPPATPQAQKAAP